MLLPMLSLEVKPVKRLVLFCGYRKYLTARSILEAGRIQTNSLYSLTSCSAIDSHYQQLTKSTLSGSVSCTGLHEMSADYC